MTAIAWGILAFALAALGTITTLAIMLSRTKDQRENNHVAAESHAKELANAKEAMARLAAELKHEQETANALDAELAKSYDHPDPVGARERMLSKWQLERAAARRGAAVAVPAPAAAKEPGPDDLIDPFSE